MASPRTRTISNTATGAKTIAPVLVGFYAYAASVAALRAFSRSWSKPIALLVSDIIPALLALTLLFVVEHRLRGSWRAVVRGLGLRGPAGRALSLGLLAGSPAAIGLGIVLLLPGVDRSIAAAWPLMVLRVLLGQVLLEELLFRGALLKRLDERFTPRKSALMAAAAFGLCHFGNLFHQGLSVGSVIESTIQALYTTILAFAPILLVRRSRGVLWGAFAWHLMLDLVILLPHATHGLVSTLIGLAGALLTVPVAWAVGRLGKWAQGRAPC